MNPGFLDTVGLIAVWDTADQWHAAAAPVFLQLVASGRPLVTTTLVLFECGNAAARPDAKSMWSVAFLLSWRADRGAYDIELVLEHNAGSSRDLR